MRRIGVIALNTFRENVRDRILYSLLLFALLLIGASVVLGGLTIAEREKIVMDMGLAAINVVGVVIAVFVGIGLVSKEIERRTIYTIMARPISRSEFILGKYAGLALTLLVTIAVMLAVFLAVLRMVQAPVRWALVQAVALMGVEALLVTALALFFSTFTTATLSAIMTLGLYVIGHLTGDLKGLAEKSQSEAVQAVTTALYYLIPNLELFNVKGPAAHGQPIGLAYLALGTAYGAAYLTLLLAAACLVFQRRDF